MYLISGNITSNVTGNLLVITGNGNIGNITSNFRTLGSGNDNLHLLHCFPRMSHFVSLMQCSEGLFLCSAVLEIV